MSAIDHSFIGKEYPPITYEICREKIREYARAVGDLNPLYLDEEAGRLSPYGDMVAPPAMAGLFRLLPAEYLFTDPAIGIDFPMLVHAEQDNQYFQVIRPNDRLRITGRIADIFEKGRLQFIVFETAVRNAQGELAMLATATYAIRPREEGGG